jgi:hypothetical protein
VEVVAGDLLLMLSRETEPATDRKEGGELRSSEAIAVPGWKSSVYMKTS